MISKTLNPNLMGPQCVLVSRLDIELERGSPSFLVPTSLTSGYYSTVSQQMSTPRLTVAIWSNSGGGISGLCLAVALSRCADVRVELYEAAGRFAEIGAGVMIWSRTWRVLELMGLADAFSNGLSATDWRALKGSGLTFGGRTCLQKGSAFTSSSCHVSKVASVQAWSPAESTLAHTYFPQTAVSVFTERTSSTSSSTACLWASRTSTSASRLTTRCPMGPWSCVSRMARGRRVICSSGATGLRAACARRCCVSSRGGKEGREEWAECSQPVFSGTVAYRGLVPVERLTVGGRVHRTVESPMMYCGKNKHVVSYSIARGSVVNVVAFSSEPEKEGTPCDGPWVAPCAREELLACYAGWEPEVRELLECIEAPTRWTLHDLRPLPTFATRNVVLVGDAAHAMLPHQGAGAGQAIEVRVRLPSSLPAVSIAKNTAMTKSNGQDAYVLASLLGHPSTTRETLVRTLKVYEMLRMAQAQRVQRGSRESGRMYEFDHAEYGERYAVLGPAIEGQWAWLTEGSAEEDVGRGVELLSVGGS
ncbi:hypothetical protein EW146_g1292 [Bondarzewia mesenterica]|uniref:FAD-binding domain-containing protein n=1 Tax=Bondarzewia mesenterica TaxID=1095465 RepID=A0A4S4M4S2_9AGAM|nr:hypothetical protein EW146_g1292 [Bondarzewia mesenterica]